MEYLVSSREVARVDPAQPEPMIIICFLRVAILLRIEEKAYTIGGSEV